MEDTEATIEARLIEASSQVLHREAQFGSIVTPASLRECCSLLLSFVGIGECCIVQAIPGWQAKSPAEKAVSIAFLISTQSPSFDSGLFNDTIFTMESTHANAYVAFLSSMAGDGAMQSVLDKIIKEHTWSF